MIDTNNSLNIFKQELDAIIRKECKQLIYWCCYKSVDKLYNIIIFICHFM